MYSVRIRAKSIEIMTTRIEKLEANASYLLDIFSGLCEKFAMLEPMLLNKAIVRTKGSGHQSRGFRILRHPMFCRARRYSRMVDTQPGLAAFKGGVDSSSCLGRRTTRRTPWSPESTA